MVGNISLRNWGDLSEFVMHMAAPQDLQLVCKECHKIKSYAERVGMSFDNARREKKVIGYMKMPVKNLTFLLNNLGYTGPLKNRKEREVAIREVLVND